MNTKKPNPKHTLDVSLKRLLVVPLSSNCEQIFTIHTLNVKKTPISSHTVCAISFPFARQPILSSISCGGWLLLARQTFTLTHIK